MIAVAFIGVSCADSATKVARSILGAWAVERVVYDDGSERVLGPGNFVEIEPEAIVERIQDGSVRRYPYTRSGPSLLLENGSSRAEWVVLEQTNELLRVTTPIGIYILRREQ